MTTPQTRDELVRKIKDLVSAPIWRTEDPTVAALVLSQVSGVSMTFHGSRYSLGLEVEPVLLDRLSSPGTTDPVLRDIVWALERDLGFARANAMTVESAIQAAAREWRGVDPRAISVFQDGEKR